MALPAAYTSAAPLDMSACASPISGCAKQTELTFEPQSTGAPLSRAMNPLCDLRLFWISVLPAKSESEKNCHPSSASGTVGLVGSMSC